MPAFDLDYTTLTSIKRTLEIGASDTSEDEVWRVFIRMASNWFTTECDRQFVPVQATREYDRFGNHIGGRILNLDDDLLEVTAIANGDGTAIASSSYVLRPSNVTPKYRIELLPSVGVQWAYTDNWQDSISVSGVWGYHETYDRAWKSMTTLAGAVNGSAMSVTVTSATGLEVLDYIRVGSEYLQITAISGTTLTVLRGVNGTTAAAHDSGAGVSQYQQTPRVKLAVERLASFYYDHRKTVGTKIEVAGSTTYVDGVIPNDVRGAVWYFARPTLGLAWSG